MEITDGELDALCDQLTLTACYWSSFDSLSHLDDRDSMDPGRGVYQMMHLLSPYLGPDEKVQIYLMSRDYL